MRDDIANDIGIHSTQRRWTGSVRPVRFNSDIIGTRCLPAEDVLRETFMFFSNGCTSVILLPLLIIQSHEAPSLCSELVSCSTLPSRPVSKSRSYFRLWALSLNVNMEANELFRIISDKCVHTSVISARIGAEWPLPSPWYFSGLAGHEQQTVPPSVRKSADRRRCTHAYYAQLRHLVLKYLFINVCFCAIVCLIFVLFNNWTHGIWRW